MGVLKVQSVVIALGKKLVMNVVVCVCVSRRVFQRASVLKDDGKDRMDL